MKLAALSRPRRVPSLLLALSVFFCATASPLLAARFKTSHTGTTHEAFKFEGDERYTSLDYSLGSDRLEILYPTDRSLETLVWANGWQFRLSPGFAADWLHNTLTRHDTATIRAIQQRLNDPLALSAELEDRMAREILGRYSGIDVSRLDPCDPGLNAALFGAFGISVISTAVGCLTAVTGVGAILCGAGVVGIIGGVTALILSDQGCNGDPPPEKPGAGDGDGGQGGDGGNPLDPDPPTCPTDPLEPPDDECPAF